MEASLDLDLVPVLARAPQDDTLVLHFQPEVDLATGAIVGMEALLRLAHPQRGLLWPAEFLAVAEAAGLLPALGWWVLERCAEELGSWRPLPPAVDGTARQLWVNVAGAQLVEDGFVARIRRLVAEHGLAPGQLGLEVTEEGLIAAGDAGARMLLESLADAGVALALDDFGTWYSSLGTLGELPLQAVKLDRTFVRGVGTDLDGDGIVSSVVALAHAHGLRVVAEGVESWSEGARLCDLGCDRALGYLFSGPQRADQARLMLAHGTGWSGRLPGQRSGSTADVASAP